MIREKMVYISADAHRRLKVLSARQSRPMGELVEELVEREAEVLSNPWASQAGLKLQQKALAEAWDDPEMDVYDED
jgi:predicted DNA-binding protein